MKLNFLLAFIVITSYCNAQRITGTVFTENGDLLPFASVTVKGTTRGASANQKGNFSFSVPNGTYTIVCQSIGYTASEKEVIVAGADVEISFILKQQKLLLQEVTVKSNAEDPAYAIIRQAIKMRPYYEDQLKAFSCDLYTKDLIRTRKMPDRIFGRKIKEENKREMGVDSAGRGIIYLSESVARVHKKQPDKFKMEILSSRVSGSESFGLTFPAFISLYTNNVLIFTQRFNPRGFVSPIADGAIHFYKYKFLGNFWENGKMIHSIRVIPRRAYEPLFSGTINISDDDWRIHSVDLLLTKRNQLELLDTLAIKQLHVPVSEAIWQVKSQLLFFDFNVFGVQLAGNFQTVYSNFDIQPSFDKKFFDRIVIKYDTAANKRSRNYWDTIRPVPLESEEQKDYSTKDSLYALRKDSLFSKTNVDSMRKNQGSIKPWDIFLKGIHRQHFGKGVINQWGIESLLKNLEYNTVEGAVVKLNAYYSGRLNKKTQFNIDPSIRYGFSNRHINAHSDFYFNKRHPSLTNASTDHWLFSGGKRVSSFNNNNTFLEVLRNSISTLFYGNNFLKIYENYYGNIAFSRKYESGVAFKISALYENRIPLNNTTTFTVNKKDSHKLTVNYPFEKIPNQFSPHPALSFTVNLTWTPGQRYIQFPQFKLPLGSKFPTFSFNYTKGLNGIFRSDVDYDKWNAGVFDTRNFRLAGTFRYRASVGGFLNSKKVYIQDYQHFNGNPTRSAAEYLNSFQLAGYYTNSTVASLYGLAHIEHHFNGLITNKIPLFRKLNWNLVAGSNAFYVNPNSNYVELFAGIENIFKTLRVDFVAGYQNGIKGVTGIRIGSGGSLGTNIFKNSTARRRGNSIQISF